MPVPKKKTSRSKRGMRRSHDALTKPNVLVCSNCQEPKIAHHVCPSCGFYDGKEVIVTEEA